MSCFNLHLCLYMPQDPKGLPIWLVCKNQPDKYLKTAMPNLFPWSGTNEPICSCENTFILYKRQQEPGHLLQ